MTNQFSQCKAASSGFIPNTSVIRCIKYPEWGVFRVVADHGGYYELLPPRILVKDEAVSGWEVVNE